MMSDYIAHTRFKGRALCYVKSDNAHNHFARNDDGQGMTRGKIIRAIQNRLAKRDNDHQNRWDKVWEDAVCQQYKRTDHADYWLWNHAFFEAPIHDLQHIAGLVGARIEV